MTTAPDGGGLTEAERAWLVYRDEYQRANPWRDPRRAARQMRKREFVAGFLAARSTAPDTEAVAAALAEVERRVRQALEHGGTAGGDAAYRHVLSILTAVLAAAIREGSDT